MLLKQLQESGCPHTGLYTVLENSSSSYWHTCVWLYQDKQLHILLLFSVSMQSWQPLQSWAMDQNGGVPLTSSIGIRSNFKWESISAHLPISVPPQVEWGSIWLAVGTECSRIPGTITVLIPKPNNIDVDIEIIPTQTNIYPKHMKKAKKIPNFYTESKCKT